MPHGSGVRILLVSEVDLGALSNLELNWVFDSDYMNPKTFCLWSCNNAIYVRQVSLYRTPSELSLA